MEAELEAPPEGCMAHGAVGVEPMRVLMLGPRDAALPPGMAAAAPTTRFDWRAGAQRHGCSAGPSQNLWVANADLWPREGDAYDAVVVSDLDADVHPLALFDALAAVLDPEGVVWLRAHDEAPLDWNAWGAWARRAGWLLEAPQAAAGWGCLRVNPTAPRWRVAHALPRHYPEIADLFARTFGHELSVALWQWKYAEGRGNAVLARRDGRLVAHYGGMYRDVLREGQPERVAQIGDVMVDAGERGVLTRQGPFALVSMTWPEIYGPKGFGFPTDRALRVAEKLGVYAQADEMVEASWGAQASRLTRLMTRLRPVGVDGLEGGRWVDRLWEQMARDFSQGVIGVRDWAYVQHRYFAHPHHRYEVFQLQARWSRKPLALLVVRRHEDYLEWLDFIGPLSRLDLMVDRVRGLAWSWGIPRVVLWCTARHAERFSALQAQTRPLGLAIPASCWPDPTNPARYAGKWWLTAGDTDFR